MSALEPSLLLAACFLACFLGGVSQRATGIGFALIATPGLVIVLGPVDGVLVVNICGAIGAGLASLQVYRDIDWRMFLRVTIPAVLFIPLGAMTVMVVDGDTLQFLIGLLVLLALVLPLIVSGIEISKNGKLSVFAAGALLGYINCAAGVGGPALAAYALLTRWEYTSFRATAQPIFLVVGSISFIARSLAGIEGSGILSPEATVVCVVATIAGVLAGAVVSRWIPLRFIKRASILIAFAGSLFISADAGIRIVNGALGA